MKRETTRQGVTSLDGAAALWNVTVFESFGVVGLSQPSAMCFFFENQIWIELIESNPAKIND